MLRCLGVTERVEPQIVGDALLMVGDRRLPFSVDFDQVWVNPQLCRAKANQFLKELEGLLLREAIEVPERKRPDRQSRAGYEGANTCRAARNLPRLGWRLA